MPASEHSPYRSPLTLIGYWTGSNGGDGWPDPTEFVDEGWDEDERTDLALYLERGLVARAYMGYSQCRICGANNGNEELSDGSFIWPEGLAHYVREHAVRLPDSFTAHVARMEELTDDLVVDDLWWRSQSH